MAAPGAAETPAVRIDADNEWAWCGERRLSLMPKAFAVLRHLVDHAGRLITKDELLGEIWRGTVVSDAALTSCIRDLRKALGDLAQAPRYIQTVHRRGFRFIGPIASTAVAPLAADSGASVEGDSPRTAPTLVARDTELARLRALLGRAVNRRRQLVFVTGEPGIGKTALVEAFVDRMGVGEPLRVGRGRCVEQYGAGESYLPVLEALGRLGRSARGDEIVRVLKQHAPTWLVQLPALLSDEDVEIVQRRAQGATRERMLRELAEAFDALTVDAPLVLVLEDLHWSDPSTIDLLAVLARRHEAARLLIVATFRPADVAVTNHPLKAAKREMELHGHCEEIALEFLSVPAVTEYLARRFGQEPWLTDLATLLHRRTDGNPLFLVSTIDLLLAEGQVRAVDGRWVLAAPVKALVLNAPETLTQMVEKQMERLTPDEHATLRVASVAGAEFSAAIAAAHGIDVAEAERRCEALARRGQFVRTAGVAEWPDGIVAGRYAFIHALYQQVLYARIPAANLVELHRWAGGRLEQAYDQRTGEIAGELAMHFTQGRDFARAARYHQQAGGNALRQHGYREAADHLTVALSLHPALPDTPARREQELGLQVTLGSALLALKGHAAAEVERAYARARELCEQVDDSPRLLQILRALGRFYVVRGSLDAAGSVGQRLRRMAESTADTATSLAAHEMLGDVSFYRGELEAALTHLDHAIALHAPATHPRRASSTFRPVLDSGVSCTAHAAWTLWMLGYPTRAAVRMREALTLAHSIGHPFSLAHAYRFAAALHQVCRERDAVREQAGISFALAAEHTAGETASRYYGFSAVLMAADFHRGWRLVDDGRAEEGLASMRAWVKTCRETGSAFLLPTYLAWLAEACGKIGQRREGLDLVAEALAVATGPGIHYWTAELYRLRGELVKSDTEAESSFREALAVAQRQQARSLELRAATSLSRLWAKQEKVQNAHGLLSKIHGWFTEGLDTADLNDARALLESLAQSMTRGKTARPRHRGRAVSD